jgi:hypothetical protein
LLDSGADSSPPTDSVGFWDGADSTAPPEGDSEPAAPADAGLDGPPEAEAAACAPCPPQYNCVVAPSGLQTTLSDTEEPNGTCLFGSAQLYCGGTGIAANGTPLTWAAGPGYGPSGGPGLVVSFQGAQFNCE